MSWKEKRLITILSIILAVLCAAVLVVLSIRYRAAQAAKDQNTVSPSDIAEAAQSEYVALSYSNGSTTLSFSLNEDGIWTWDSEPDFPLDDTHVKSILTILETLKPQQTLDMPEDLSVYGLDVPDVSLTATAPDDAVLTVTLGNATTDGTSYYATINSDPDHVFILAGTLLFSAFRDKIEHWEYPQRFTEYVEYYAGKYGIDPMILYAFIRTESNFDPNADSDAGARGLMQITEVTFDWIKMKIAPTESLTFDVLYDPETNIRFGSYFVSYCLDRYSGHLATAAAAYHSGVGTVDGLLGQEAYSTDGVTLDHYPYPQMRLYGEHAVAAEAVYHLSLIHI